MIHEEMDGQEEYDLNRALAASMLPQTASVQAGSSIFKRQFFLEGSGPRLGQRDCSKRFYEEIDGQGDYDLHGALVASLLPQPTSQISMQAGSSTLRLQLLSAVPDRAVATIPLPQPASQVSRQSGSSTLGLHLPSTGSEPPRRRHKSDREFEDEGEKNNILEKDEMIEGMKILKEEKRYKAENPVVVPMRYSGGALRLTRTPGRSEVNTVTMEQLVHPYELCSAFVFAFCIDNDYFFRYFPFKRPEENYPGRPHCRILVGRDLAYDGVGKEFANMKTPGPISTTEQKRIIKIAHAKYSELYGRNFHAFYPEKSGNCAHSKIMILIYPDFLRLIITSANFIPVDLVCSDNHWFIQDFPRLSLETAADPDYKKTVFEKELIQHLEDLECPDEFLKMQLRAPVFDFSAAKVYIISSKPGSHSGADARSYGQLRLRDVVRKNILRNSTKDPKLTFEVCVGSVGVLNAQGMVTSLLESCAGGRQISVEGSPALKMVFPTRSDVTESYTPGIGTISSHMDWKALAEDSYLKGLFYHHHSKDLGRMMFHMKSILALRQGAPPTAPPLYMYVGSHNFSAAAWGTVCNENRAESASASSLRLAGVGNLECGVVVRDSDIVGMLETEEWGDVVPYERPSAANKYKKDEWPYRAPPPKEGLPEP
ncbi:tyrosyl-DNA phosphodiesterase-domain-containing protein [Mycena rosella]|uniref:Tyrosyl-DNA phosphodiesterase-domain-containing protein n=1 Tax=Mycena rosella TaxID=1033263 RepID=A0AAD7CUU5_MYCRO|nr:tyrosyl-DNA phosphodiesterase-domain-containing protein [Mycena rosella]